jgi:GH25 family lysozyme M1 (1,4-beta-N-acetylmuramidase)
MANGIDVSRWQGEINWSAVRNAGIEFAYIKTTDGAGHVSPTVDVQMAGARAAGLIVGAYHYGQPRNNPAADAHHFAGQLRRLNAWQAGNLPPCLDIEEQATRPAGWVRGFIDALRAELGRREVMVYASSSYVSGPLGGEGWADDGVTLWVAHYGRAPGQPGYLTPRVVMHQHSSTGRVPGIGGNVDLDLCMVDLSALAGRSTPAPGPAPVPPPPAPSPGTYTVKAGDTLSGIGAALGVDWHEIARVNGLSDPNRIFPGQVLRLPSGPAPRTHRVQPGDTLSGIGARYGVNWRDIARVNGISNPNRIFPGQVLTIP